MNDKDLKEEVKKLFVAWHAEVTGETNINFVPDMQVENLINETVALIAAKTTEARISGAMELAIGMTVFNDNQAIKDYGVKQFKMLSEEKAELQTLSEKGNQ